MAPRTQSSATGASIIARSLKDSGVAVIFGIVGVPVSDIAEQAINLGIRFIGFRNEQAASYAATAYGYLTGRPGVCLVVGGPGVLHAVAGVSIPSTHCALSTLFGRSQCVRTLKRHNRMTLVRSATQARTIFRCYFSVDPSNHTSSPRAPFKRWILSLYSLRRRRSH